MITKWILASSLVGGIVSGAGAVNYSLSTGPPMVTVQALQANPLVAGIGVNTHLSYTNTAYNDINLVIASLRYLNVWNIRDYGLIPGLANLGNYNLIAAAGGKFIQQIGTGFQCSTQSCVSNVLDGTFSNIDAFATAFPGSILAIEGSNEINNTPVIYPPNLTGETAAIAWQQNIFNRAQADPHTAGLPFLTFTGGNFPNQSGWLGTFTVNNEHVYSGDGEQNMCPICLAGMSHQYNASFIDPAAPLWITETGYETCNTCLDWISIGPMVLNDLIDFYFISQSPAGSGLQLDPSPAMVFIYELVDEDGSGNGWGLFYHDGRPKPSATGVANLVKILSDPGPAFAPSSLTFAVAGLAPPNNSLSAAGGSTRLLQKRNGVFDIVIQNEQITYNSQTSTYVGCKIFPVTITLGTAASTIRVYDPVVQSTPLNIYSNSSAVTVNSCSDPVIVEVVP